MNSKKKETSFSENNSFTLLPTELNSFIYSLLSIGETINLSNTCKSFSYLSNDDASLWKKDLPGDIENFNSLRLVDSSPRKVRVSLNDVGIIEGNKMKWMLYKYIKFKKDINVRTYDLKIFNEMLVSQRRSINRIRQNTTRSDIMKQYDINIKQKIEKESILRKEVDRLNVVFHRLSIVNKRVTHEANSSWKVIKTRLIFDILFVCIKNKTKTLNSKQLDKKIYTMSNGRFQSYRLGQGSNSLLLIKYPVLNINSKLIDKMQEYGVDQYNKGNKCFEWFPKQNKWNVKFTTNEENEKILHFIY
mgnify:CR=1 FL=1